MLKRWSYSSLVLLVLTLLALWLCRVAGRLNVQGCWRFSCAGLLEVRLCTVDGSSFVQGCWKFSWYLEIGRVFCLDLSWLVSNCPALWQAKWVWNEWGKHLHSWLVLLDSSIPGINSYQFEKHSCSLMLIHVIRSMFLGQCVWHTWNVLCIMCSDMCMHTWHRWLQAELHVCICVEVHLFIGFADAV